MNPDRPALRPVNGFNLPVGDVALEVNHVVRYRGDARRRGGDGDDGCCGGRGGGGGDSGGLRLAGAVMRLLLAALRGGPRGWAAPRPAFRKESVQVSVLQDQACHRHGAFMSRSRMSILLRI